MIRPFQQRPFRFFVGLLYLWLTHLDTGTLEALAAMQTADKRGDTIAQAFLLTPPPMARCVHDDAMFTLPACDAKVPLV